MGQNVGKVGGMLKADGVALGVSMLMSILVGQGFAIN